MEKIQSSGLGMAIKWSPQQSILNHPVLLMFQLLLVQVRILKKIHRRLDGSLRMEVLTVLPNLLRAVFPCKEISLPRFTLAFTTHLLGVLPFLIV